MHEFSFWSEGDFDGDGLAGGAVIVLHIRLLPLHWNILLLVWNQVLFFCVLLSLFAFCGSPSPLHNIEVPVSLESISGCVSLFVCVSAAV